jgi:hypothetical protein
VLALLPLYSPLEIIATVRGLAGGHSRLRLESCQFSPANPPAKAPSLQVRIPNFRDRAETHFGDRSGNRGVYSPVSREPVCDALINPGVPRQLAGMISNCRPITGICFLDNREFKTENREFLSWKHGLRSTPSIFDGKTRIARPTGDRKAPLRRVLCRLPSPRRGCLIVARGMRAWTVLVSGICLVLPAGRPLQCLKGHRLIGSSGRAAVRR